MNKYKLNKNALLVNRDKEWSEFCKKFLNDADRGVQREVVKNSWSRIIFRALGI